MRDPSRRTRLCLTGVSAVPRAVPRCRGTAKILLGFGGESDADEKKSRNSTNELLKTEILFDDQNLGEEHLDRE